MYDLGQIKSIPCADVAAKYGIQLKKVHNKLWGKLRREDKTSSFNISEEKNFWHDFGSGKGGSVIDLVMELEGITMEKAISKLAQDYGFETQKTLGWSPLTDNQYKVLGIQPERATMNFNFDLNKHSIEKLERWSNKYGMPVKDLAIKYPKVYNDMITSISTRLITSLRDSYHANLALYQDPNNNQVTREFIKTSLKRTSQEINEKVDLLQRAVVGKKADFSILYVNCDKDLNEVLKQRGLNKSNEKDIKKLEDEKIKDRIVSAYKKLFNFDQIKYFTTEQAKALNDLNKVVTKEDNKFIKVEGINEAYKLIGKKIDNLQIDYANVIKEAKTFNNNKNHEQYKNWEKKVENIRDQLIETKELFVKCDLVIKGIRESGLALKNEKIKQNISEKTITKTHEATL